MGRLKELLGSFGKLVHENVLQWGISVVVHVCIIALLSLMLLDTGSVARIAQVVSDLAEFKEEEEIQEQLTPDEELDMDAPVSLTPSPGTGELGAASDSLANPMESVQMATAAAIVSDRSLTRPLLGGVAGMNLGDNVTGLKGVSELAGNGGDAGVIDRISQEILRQLDKNKVIVAWVFDSSGSLKERREAIAERFDRIYKELDELGVNENESLLTAVVSVGQDTKFLLDQPTNKLEYIRAAIRKVRDDETGLENIFTAVRETALKYRNFQTSGRRTLMIVVLTDEIGDDTQVSDETTATLKRNDVPLYAMGPMATFSRPVIHDVWIDPKTKFRFWLPMKRGPYTREEEILRVPFNGRAYLSGFGPFHMVQMTRETGGIFFIYGDNRVRGQDYNMDLLMRYKANYGPESEYIKEINVSDLRKTLMDVIIEGNKFWHVDYPHDWLHALEFREEIERRRADIMKFVTFASKALPALESVESQLAQETELRWRANFELTLARMLQAKVRCDEYVWALEDFRLNPRTLKDPKKNNGWVHRLTPELHVGTKPGMNDKEKAAAAEKARKAGDASRPDEMVREMEMLAKSQQLYRRVLEEHSGTPWAEAARVEVSLNAGINWLEAFDQDYAATDEEKKKRAAVKVPKL